MQKIRLILPATILMTLSLTACGNIDQGAGNEALPIGYYSNENHEESGGHTNWLNEDNDGPLTEMMDHSLGSEGKHNHMRGLNNNAAPGGEYDDTLFSRSDRNYHRHLNGNNAGARNSYRTAYDGELAKRISNAAASVVNVADARTVIQGDRVLIGAVLEDPKREEETKESIKDVVESYLDGKDLTVVTNDSIYSEMRTIDNDLREGWQMEEINDQINGLFRTIREDIR